MADIFKLNGKDVVAKDIDFDTFCSFEEHGLGLGDIMTKNFSTLRAYIAICLGVSDDVASTEFNNHVVNGGSYTEIRDILDKKASESAFLAKLLEELERDIQKQKEQTEKKVQPQDHKKSSK